MTFDQSRIPAQRGLATGASQDPRRRCTQRPACAEEVDAIAAVLRNPPSLLWLRKLIHVLAPVQATEVEDYEVVRVIKATVPGWTELTTLVDDRPDTAVTRLLQLVHMQASLR
jgi:hypothetical protein